MEQLSQTLKLLGHPDRLRILSLLRRGELTVSELVTVLQLSQPRVTQYIRSMEQCGLIERLREGSWVFSRLVTDASSTARMARAVLEQISPSDPTLSADMERLQEVLSERASRAEHFFADVANNRGQLSYEFLPQSRVESTILETLGDRHFESMVDLGTGTGRMLALLSDKVTKGIGIDLSPEMLRVARHMLVDDSCSHLTVQLSDLTCTSLQAGCADLVTLHQVLHHLDRPVEALREAERLLAPGGTLLIVDFAKHDYDEFRDRYAHRRLGFSNSEIADTIRTLGFISVESEAVPSKQDGQPDLLIWTASRAKQFEPETP